MAIIVALRAHGAAQRALARERRLDHEIEVLLKLGEHLASGGSGPYWVEQVRMLLRASGVDRNELPGLRASFDVDPTPAAADVAFQAIREKLPDTEGTGLEAFGYAPRWEYYGRLMYEDEILGALRRRVGAKTEAWGEVPRVHDGAVARCEVGVAAQTWGDTWAFSTLLIDFSGRVAVDREL